MKFDKLDSVFSRFIRLRDSDNNGYCRCITCGEKVHWREMDAGHFLSRRHIITRFDELNVHPQCKKCNQLNYGEYKKYLDNMIKIYGQEVVDELIFKSKNIIKKYSQQEIDELYEYYKEKLKKYEKFIV